MKIITALENPKFNEKLRSIENLEVVSMDIQYQEGILESLEENDVDILVMSDTLPGEYDLSELINKIRKINKNLEIVMFLKENNENIENFLMSQKIFRIYYDNETEYIKFLNSFNENKETTEKTVGEEINIFKQYLIENTSLTEEQKEDENLSFFYDYENEFFERKGKTIVIAGNFGSGKSVIACMLAQSIAYQNRKTLLIDLDIENPSIYTILGLYFKDKIEEIYEINSNFHVLKKINQDFSFENETECFWLQEMINKYKKIYDYIIIDVSSNINYKYVKTVLKAGNKILFLVEPNILEIKKGRNLLEEYVNELEVDVDKIKIIFNKTNKYKIAKSILEEVFPEFEVIGSIKYDERYSLFVNRHFSNLEKSNDIERIQETICQN